MQQPSLLQLYNMWQPPQWEQKQLYNMRQPPQWQQKQLYSMWEPPQWQQIATVWHMATNSNCAASSSHLSGNK